MRFINALCLSKNVGDTQVASPVTYYKELHRFRTVAIDTYEPQPDDVVIFGGGGLGHYNDLLLQLIPKVRKSISWAVGGNKHDCTGWYCHEALKCFGLIGNRDIYGAGKHVMCPSCKSPFFEKLPLATSEVVLAYHHQYPLWHRKLKGRCNTGNFQAWLRFLASGHKIITNSYHALYWGILMGREVVMVAPWSSKFYSMPWPVPMVAKVNDALHIQGYKTEGELARWRHANDEYLQDVLAYIKDELDTAAATRRPPNAVVRHEI